MAVPVHPTVQAEVQLQSFFILVLGEVSGQFHGLVTLSPHKDTPSTH